MEAVNIPEKHQEKAFGDLHAHVLSTFPGAKKRWAGSKHTLGSLIVNQGHSKEDEWEHWKGHVRYS